MLFRSHTSRGCWQNRAPLPPPSSTPAKAMVRAPPPPKASNYNNRPPGKVATVNNITTEEAEKATDVVLGMLPVNSILTKVLFDTGASHSFVS